MGKKGRQRSINAGKERRYKRGEQWLEDLLRDKLDEDRAVLAHASTPMQVEEKEEARSNELSELEVTILAQLLDLFPSSSPSVLTLAARQCEGDASRAVEVALAMLEGGEQENEMRREAEEEEEKGVAQTLPLDILQLVFSPLSVEVVIMCARVCKQWKKGVHQLYSGRKEIPLNRHTTLNDFQAEQYVRLFSSPSTLTMRNMLYIFQFDKIVHACGSTLRELKLEGCVRANAEGILKAVKVAKRLERLTLAVSEFGSDSLVELSQVTPHLVQLCLKSFTVNGKSFASALLFWPNLEYIRLGRTKTNEDWLPFDRNAVFAYPPPSSASSRLGTNGEEAVEKEKKVEEEGKEGASSEEVEEETGEREKKREWIIPAFTPRPRPLLHLSSLLLHSQPNIRKLQLTSASLTFLQLHECANVQYAQLSTPSLSCLKADVCPLLKYVAVANNTRLEEIDMRRCLALIGIVSMAEFQNGGIHSQLKHMMGVVARSEGGRGGRGGREERGGGGGEVSSQYGQTAELYATPVGGSGYVDSSDEESSDVSVEIGDLSDSSFSD
uniref:F-box domain-containing protein n=1 Tax=Palpitomonas bilix TaxID=652834 RepID=A0A7S3FZ53_9EUKA|mmetsp:Transcript_15370/g.38861  ORF Transcript_15370/g.38861 Transcript_15370/m.38861 type:complete len:554 (+) Transcript_15370:186-1847(+)